jgi:hypothetical protein
VLVMLAPPYIRDPTPPLRPPYHYSSPASKAPRAFTPENRTDSPFGLRCATAGESDARPPPSHQQQQGR